MDSVSRSPHMLFFSFIWKLLASCFVNLKGLVWYLRWEGHVLNSHVIFCLFAIGTVYVLLELTVLEAYYKVAFGLASWVIDGLWCRILWLQEFVDLLDLYYAITFIRFEFLFIIYSLEAFTCLSKHPVSNYQMSLCELWIKDFSFPHGGVILDP